jgi:hypothetical protein
MSKTDEFKRIDDLIAEHARASRRRMIIAALLTILVILGLSFAIFGQDIRREWRHQATMRDHAERHANMTQLELAHVEHFPSWIIELSNQRPDEPDAYAALTLTLADDPISLQLLDELRGLLLDRDSLLDHAERLLAIITTWNGRMDQADKPWWVDGNILTSAQGSLFYIKTYKVLADFTVKVSALPYRTRINARADHTNVVESMLGHTSPHQDGAIILADRIYDFSLREIWPLLATMGDDEEIDPTQRTFAPRVRAELQRALPQALFELLTTHAHSRRQLERVLTSVRERRTSCGSNFSISDLPWRGFPEEEMTQLRRFARQDLYNPCPSIKEEEVATLASASEALSAEARLEGAVEHMVAYVSRPISIHEARHAADHAVAKAFTQPLDCTTCDEAGLSRAARAELSAYLATFASDELPYTALFQTCGIDLQRGTPHASALRFLLPRLEVDCASAPPDDLGARARQLELELFGRSDAITLPANYPERIELYKK